MKEDGDGEKEWIEERQSTIGENKGEKKGKRRKVERPTSDAGLK